MKLTENTILIAGGTSGIGRGLAEAFHARGNRVIIAGRRQELLDDITRRNDGMVSVKLNVADPGSIAEAAAHLRANYPTLNVVLANAGISRPENYHAERIDAATAEDLIQTNVLGVVRLTAALLPLLKQQAAATLMATSSGLGFVPLPSYPSYSATKAFVHAWLEALRFQLHDTSVEILELIPPYVQTELGGKHTAHDPRAMPLKDFITEVIGILERGDHAKGEILVNAALPYRWAERDGTYADLLQQLGNF